MARGIMGNKEAYFNPEKGFLGKNFDENNSSWGEAMKKTEKGVEETRKEALLLSNFEREMQERVDEYFQGDAELSKGIPPEQYFRKLEEELDHFGYEAAFIANYFKEIVKEKKEARKQLH